MLDRNGRETGTMRQGLILRRSAAETLGKIGPQAESAVPA